jgi:predicted nuclease with TOPRIM domain
MAFLVALVGLEGFLYLGIRTQYEELHANHVQLETLYANLDLNYSSLNTSHQALLSEYSSLQSSYESLTQLYASLQTQHASLSESYNSLQESYQWLESLYSELGETLGIERTLRIGNSLESYYDAVRNDEGPESWWTDQKEVDFCADLAMHDLGLVS